MLVTNLHVSHMSLVYTQEPSWKNGAEVCNMATKAHVIPGPGSVEIEIEKFGFLENFNIKVD